MSEREERKDAKEGKDAKRGYLRLSRLKLALVINFGQAVLKNGIRRVVNRL